MTTTHTAPTHPMATRRIAPTRLALAAACSALALWAAKAASIAVLGVDGGLASVLFVAGLAAFMVAVVALAVTTSWHRHLGVRILTSAAAVALGTVVSLLINALIESYRQPESGAHWVWAELNLWIVGSTVLVLAVVLHRRARDGAERA